MPQVRKRGNNQYQARIRITGHPESSRTFPTKPEAIAWANTVERQILQGHGNSLRELNKTTLKNALGRYLVEITPLKKGCNQERCRILKWQDNAIANLPLAMIRGADLAEYRDLRLASGTGANTVRLDLALISHLYEVARKDWGFETLANPVKAIRKPKLPRGRERRLNSGEEAKLLAYCESKGLVLIKAIIVIAIETAMRRGEVANLTWDSVDLNTRLVHLHQTKNGDRRSVPLSTRALQAFQTLPRVAGDLILDVHRDNLTQAFKAACRACGIEGLTLHDLRHEATSRLFEKGFNMMEVSTITGHKSLSMLKRYTHLRPSDLLTRLG